MIVKRLIDFINEKLEIVSEEEVRIYAWLYFLDVVYKGEMKQKSWENDDRMGVTFIDSMKYLEKEGFAIFDDGIWYSTSNARPKILNIFGNPKTRVSAELFNNPNTKNIKNKEYPIDKIPHDLYDRLNTLEVENKLTFSRETYYKILDWWSKYQRDPHIGWKSWLDNYTGATGDLIQDRDYVLYRGIVIKQPFKNKLGDKIKTRNISWTSSLMTASYFAQGNKGLGDNRKLKKDELGIVLKYKFPRYDILLDTEYLEAGHHIFKNYIDFPSEYEVVVSNKPVYARIYKIIYPN